MLGSSTPAAAKLKPHPALGSTVASWDGLRASGRYRDLEVRHGRVVGFTRVFDPAASQVPVLEEMQRSILPPEAMVIDQGVLSNCEVVVYRVPKSTAIPRIGREFGLRLYSGSDDSAFDPRRVTRVVVSPGIRLVS